jgi:hypothetical protein
MARENSGATAMWFTDEVSVPDEIVDALIDDRLVIFVGAGASVRAPSGLPLFDMLVNRVADDLGFAPYLASKHHSPDAYLEEIERTLEVKVPPPSRPMRERVVAQLTGSPSSPNDVHEAIVRLFPQADKVRIVTTNYDRHLETAAAEAFSIAPNIYRAPALPRGDDFEGIVHLHGCLGDKLTDLVLTSRDFGRAYLTEAWASRFLYDLFRKYATLFVGYSHDDVVMRYLAQGLREGTVRHGFLANDVDASGWKAIDLSSIAYPPENEHAALARCLEDWARWTRMGRLEHEERVRQLVAGGPPSTPAAVSYLERTITNDDRAEFFWKYARGAEWLPWLELREPFQSLFRVERELSPAGRALAAWFADVIQSDSEAALRSVQRRGGHLNRATAETIALSFHQTDRRPEARALGRWSVLLTQSRGPEVDRFLGYVLIGARNRWPEDRDTAILLFEHLTAVDMAITRGFHLGDDGAEDPTEFKVDSLVGGEHELGQAWEQVLKPHLDEVVIPVVRILEHHIASAHATLRTASQANAQFDAESFVRTAIESDAQNGFPRVFDCLIDMLRECVEYLAAHRSDEGGALIARLGVTDVPLLRRIAMYGWQVRADRTADEKIDHVVESGELFAFATRREVYRLIETTASAAADGARARLLTAILAGPDPILSLGEDKDRRMIFELLDWLARAVPDDARVTGALASYQTANPGLAPSPHPGFDRWTESHFGTTSPVSAEELHGSRTVAEIETLLQAHAAADPETFFGWTIRMPQVVSDAARENPTWAIGLLSDLLANGAWDHPFWSYLFDGLGNSEGLEEHALDRTLVLVADLIGTFESSESARLVIPPVGDFLVAIVRQPVIPTELLDRVEVLGERLAMVVWSGPDGVISEETERVFERGFNHWTGRQIRFWVDVIRLRWKLEGNEWSGMPDRTKSALTALLSVQAPKSIYIKAVAAGYFNFFISADEGWATESILPFFDWQDDALAARTWSAFFAGDRSDDRALGLLLEELPETFSRVTGELSLALARWFSVQVVGTTLDLYGHGTIRAFVNATDPDNLIAFARDVGWLLHAAPPTYAEDQWARWIERYVRDRLASRPLPFAPHEAGEMLRWITVAGGLFPTAVDLYLQTDATIIEVHAFTADIKRRHLVEQFPAPLTVLLEFALGRATPGSFFDCVGIEEVLHELIPVAGPGLRRNLLAVCDAGARRGENSRPGAAAPAIPRAAL